MANDETSGSGGIVAAFLVGAFVGAAVALLFAPASGQQTRDYLSEKAREGKEKASETAQKTREALHRQRETIAAAIERGREAYRDAREKESV
jgi:gas vesicle protein